MGSSTEHPITFDCVGDRLAGIVHSGADGGDDAFVFVVGGPQYRVGSHRMFVELARMLAKQGVWVLRFDCRGMGDSDGRFVSFEGISDDIRAAIDALQGFGRRRITLLGLCDGASACAMYGWQDPRVVGMVLLNPWVRSEGSEARAKIQHYYRERVLQIESWRRLFTGKMHVARSVASLARYLSRAFGQSPTLVPYVERMLSGLRAYAGRALMLLSERDLTAQEFSGLVSTSRDWSDLVHRSNVTLETVRNADHTFSGGEDQIADVARRISEWHCEVRGVA